MPKSILGVNIDEVLTKVEYTPRLDCRDILRYIVI